MAMNDTIKLNRYFDFQQPDRIRIKGHRLGIEHILNHHLEGYNPEEIAGPGGGGGFLLWAKRAHLGMKERGETSG